MVTQSIIIQPQFNDIFTFPVSSVTITSKGLPTIYAATANPISSTSSTARIPIPSQVPSDVLIFPAVSSTAFPGAASGIGRTRRLSRG